ncbi:MAG: hypothetical protein HY919_06335, partial [Elusimicrobia bacterium]|nr:hypothetical protein [Elusimicrobiota bacterium]
MLKNQFSDEKTDKKLVFIGIFWVFCRIKATSLRYKIEKVINGFDDSDINCRLQRYFRRGFIADIVSFIAV